MGKPSWLSGRPQDPTCELSTHTAKPIGPTNTEGMCALPQLDGADMEDNEAPCTPGQHTRCLGQHTDMWPQGTVPWALVRNVLQVELRNFLQNDRKYSKIERCARGSDSCSMRGKEMSL